LPNPTTPERQSGQGSGPFCHRAPSGSRPSIASCKIFGDFWDANKKLLQETPFNPQLERLTPEGWDGKHALLTATVQSGYDGMKQINKDLDDLLGARPARATRRGSSKNIEPPMPMARKPRERNHHIWAPHLGEQPGG
jgi:hypothetical protein